jgi:hypothetical protein
MRVIHLMGATTFTDHDSGMSYQAGPDGVFDLPEHVGTFYATRHAGMFRRESDHEALLAAAKTETLRDPHNTPGTLQALLERVTAQEATVARREAFFGPLPPAGPERQVSPGRVEEASQASTTAEPEAAVEPEAEEPAEPEARDEPERDEGPAGDAPLRKPVPRRAAPKRHG